MMVDSTTAVGRPADPGGMATFGATGDLTKRKLIPSLYNLATDKLLSQQFAIIGVAIEDFSTESFRDRLTKDIHEFATGQVNQDTWNWFLDGIHYLRGDFNNPATFQSLKSLIEEACKDHNIPPNYLYYLATAPMFFGEIARQLGTAGLATEEVGHWRRV